MSAQDRRFILQDVAEAIRHARPMMGPRSGNAFVTDAHELLNQAARQIAERYGRRWPKGWEADAFLRACGCQS